jgi:hypothetical protein
VKNWQEQSAPDVFDRESTQIHGGRSQGEISEKPQLPAVVLVTLSYK